MELKVGTSLRLEEVSGEGKYYCKVVEKGEGYIYIDYPINEATKKSAFLLMHTRLKAYFVEENGVTYYFSTEVVGRIKKEIPMIKLHYKGKESLVKYQRREYVRVDATLPAALHSLDGAFEPFTTITKNISASGALLAVKEKGVFFQKGDTINVWLVFELSDQYYHIQTEAEVINILPSHIEKQHNVGVKFLTLGVKEQEALIRYTLEVQRELKRKGLL